MIENLKNFALRTNIWKILMRVLVISFFLAYRFIENELLNLACLGLLIFMLPFYLQSEFRKGRSFKFDARALMFKAMALITTFILLAYFVKLFPGISSFITGR